MAENDLDLGEEKKSSKKLVIIIAAIVAVVLIVVGTLYFMGVFSSDPQDNEENPQEVEQITEEERESASIYHALEPAFTVNFGNGGGVNLLQVSISILASSEQAVTTIKLHNPVIRNNLLLLFSGQDPQELRTRKGKEQLQGEVLKVIRNILHDSAGENSIHQVFFTGFVMQ